MHISTIILNIPRISRFAVLKSRDFNLKLSSDYTNKKLHRGIGYITVYDLNVTEALIEMDSTMFLGHKISVDLNFNRYPNACK